MDLFKQGMKGPTRPAPSVPGMGVTRYSPVTNWNDDPFGADVFEPTPQFMQKKKPPPRPPPPKVGSKVDDEPLKPSHFIRRPTVLSSLLSRNKNKTIVNNQCVSVVSHTPHSELSAELDPNRMFPKCEPKSLATGTLIDLSSPPSSPTFTTRSSSDGLSVDSFGSDATTSTNHHNVMSGGNASQAESGFEDDFDLFLHSRKALPKDDTMDDFTALDPFSPPPQPSTKPLILRKPVISRDLFESSQPAAPAPPLKGPTIIRAKPARPKPPDNSALLKNTFGDNFPMATMSLNTTTPIQKVFNGFGDSFESKPLSWDDEGSPEREASPPMPSVPPPPPPALDDSLNELLAESLAQPLDEQLAQPLDEPLAQSLAEPFQWPAVDETSTHTEHVRPYAVALFDYFTDHPEDLCFSTNSRIELLRRVDHEWLCGKLRSGAEGLFPANYVEIKVPLPGEQLSAPAPLARATALYDFEPVQPGDLRFITGDVITVITRLNDEWYFGECHGLKGQFPANYVQIS